VELQNHIYTYKTVQISQQNYTFAELSVIVQFTRNNKILFSKLTEN